MQQPLFKSAEALDTKQDVVSWKFYSNLQSCCQPLMHHAVQCCLHSYGRMSNSKAVACDMQGRRALDFVLKNQGLIDKTLLFDVELMRINQ